MSRLKSKKVLVLTSTFPRWLGDTNPPFVFELCKRLAKKFDITILTPHFSGSKECEVMEKIKIYRYKYFFERYEKLAGNGGILPTIKKNKLYIFQIPFFIFFQIASAIYLVKKYKPDIIHAHWIIPQGLTALIIKKIFNIPYIVTSHGSDLHSIGFKGLKKKILQNAEKITVVSSYLAKEVKEIDPLLLKKTEIIPMGVDIKMFNPNRYDETIKNKFNINGPFLLYIGRLAPEKGVSYLIDAIPVILKKYPKTKLMIIGGGTLEKELKDQTKKLKIDQSIIFLGNIKYEDLGTFYATADIFICPSLREGFGLTLVEAGMSGCALIGSNVGGIPDIIKNKINGFLIEPGRSLDIYKKVSLLLKDSKIITKQKKISRQEISKHFNWQQVISKYKEIYK